MRSNTDYLVDLDVDITEIEDEVTMDSDFDAWFNSMVNSPDEDTAEREDEEENWFPEDEDEDETPVAVVTPVAVKPRDPSAVRAFARANGLPVGERGIIAKSIWDAYYAA